MNVTPNQANSISFPDNNVHPSRKIPRWLLLLLGIPLICGGLCGMLYWVDDLRPQYVEINIPPMDGMLSWGYAERSIVKWTDGPKYYLWREETECIGGQCGDWNTIWQYFDDHLTKSGWVKVDNRNRCSLVSPETQFLPAGDNGYVTYVPEKYVDEVFCEGPAVCLAIWESSPDHFKIVLSSENPSFLTEYSRCVG